MPRWPACAGKTAAYWEHRKRDPSGCSAADAQKGAQKDYRDHEEFVTEFAALLDAKFGKLKIALKSD